MNRTTAVMVVGAALAAAQPAGAQETGRREAPPVPPARPAETPRPQEMTRPQERPAPEEIARPSERARPRPDMAEAERTRVQQQNLVRALETLLDEQRVQGMSAEEVRRAQRSAEELVRRLSEVSTRLALEMGERVATTYTVVSPDLRQALVDMNRGIRGSAPRGWIGLNFDTPLADRLRGGDYYVRFLHYPGVVSVDPGSPAERAGVRRGDTLVALNGHDVLREFAINRVLAPESRVVVRLRRDGTVQEVPMTVAEAPGSVVALRMAIRPSGGHSPPGVAGGTPVPGQGGEVGAGRVLVPAPAGTGGPATVVVRTMNIVAGARMENIGPGLGDVLGVREGVLVTEVSPASPAHNSGLAAGDIVVRSGNKRIGTVAALAEEIRLAEGKSLRLHVVRKGKERVVTLRW